MRISGGRIVGDRDRHLGTEGEWGHGIAIYDGVRVVVRDMHISRCWGDGISIGGKKRSAQDMRPSMDIGNRQREVHRQSQAGPDGRPVPPRVGARLRDGRYRRTAPMAGIDVEPDKGDIAQDVRIERCLVRRNRGPGIQVWQDTHQVLILAVPHRGQPQPWASSRSARTACRSAAIASGATRRSASALRKQSRNVEIAGNTFSDNAPGRPRKPTFGSVSALVASSGSRRRRRPAQGGRRQPPGLKPRPRFARLQGNSRSVARGASA